MAIRGKVPAILLIASSAVASKSEALVDKLLCEMLLRLVDKRWLVVMAWAFDELMSVGES